MTGKEKCEFLKNLRATIARDNNIPYNFEECNNKGHCNGTCPKCEQELEYLSKALEEKANKAEEINIETVAIPSAADDKYIDSDENEISAITGGYGEPLTSENHMLKGQFLIDEEMEEEPEPITGMVVSVTPKSLERLTILNTKITELLKSRTLAEIAEIDNKISELEDEIVVLVLKKKKLEKRLDDDESSFDEDFKELEKLIGADIINEW